MSDGRRWPRRIGNAVGAVVLVLVVLVLLALPAATPPPSGATGSDGTLALHRLLTGLGHRVLLGGSPTPGETFVLFADVRSEDQATVVLNWVRDGGHLVVTDPRSRVLPRVGVAAPGPMGGVAGEGPTTALRGDCVSVVTLGVESIQVRTSDFQLQTDQAGQVSCFDTGAGPYEIERRYGFGVVTVLGGHSPFVNALLSHADNALLAEAVMGSTNVVRFGSSGAPPAAVPPQPAHSVWGALPGAAKAAIIGLLVALVAFAFVRGRRLGPPVLEEPISPIPAGQLVRATANIYRKGRATAFSGSLLRAATNDLLRRRLGIPPDVDDERLAAETARLADRPERAVARALAGPPPTDDDELMALGRELEEIHQAVEGAVR